MYAVLTTHYILTMISIWSRDIVLGDRGSSEVAALQLQCLKFYHD